MAAAGADELCFLDITASSDNRETIFDIVERTAERCFMPLTVGGGVLRVSAAAGKGTVLTVVLPKQAAGVSGA